MSRRVRTATILQLDDMESGSVALGMILGYFRRYVPAEELRTACAISRDGSRPEKIVAAAKAYGLEVEEIKGEVDDFSRLSPPFIMVLRKGHFVVVEGMHRHRVYLNDPARGPIRMPLSALATLSSGLALAMKPGPGFAEGGKKPSILGSLAKRLEGSGPGLLFVLLASLAVILPELAVPIFSKLFVDHYLVDGTRHWLPIVLFGLAITGTIQASLISLRSRHLNRLSVKIGISSTARFFHHLLRLPVSFYAQRDVGDLSGRVAINTQVARILSDQVASALINAFMSIFLILMMAQFDAELTFLTVTLAALNFLFLRKANQAQMVKNQKMVQAKYAVYGQSYSGLKSIMSLKASASEGDFFATWVATLTTLVNARQNLSFATVLLNAIPATLAALSTIVILGLGGIRVIEGRMSVGDLVAFSALAVSFAAPVNKFVSFWEKVQQALAQMMRLDDVLDNSEDPEVAPRTEKENRRLKGFLELKNVKFGYDPHSPPIIDGVSLRLKPGQQVALVGTTGSGKSTVGKLICGLLTPTEGEILFDHKPRLEWSRATLTDSLALVDQNVQLFQGTVAENLSLWDESVPRERLLEAARDAGIHETISSRPGGYDSDVYEDGSNFSGGQKQRLEIARALALEPTILVLDEATSALDTKVEADVVRNLRRRGCTCVMVAHRLSTVRDCDEILVLERGRVVQRGTHEELVAQPGHYADLVKSE